MGERRKSTTSTTAVEIGSLIVHEGRLMVVRRLKPDVTAVPVGYSSSNEVVLATSQGQLWWNEADYVIPPGEVEVVTIYQEPS